MCIYTSKYLKYQIKEQQCTTVYLLEIITCYIHLNLLNLFLGKKHNRSFLKYIKYTQNI